MLLVIEELFDLKADDALKAATAYQSASKRRVPPPAFPPLPGEP